MAEPEAKALDELFNRVLNTEDEALRAAREAEAAAGMPPIEVSAQHGKLLFLLATAMHASRVLELGTLAGYSTIQLARAVGPGGRVVTLEFEPKHAEVARQIGKPGGARAVGAANGRNPVSIIAPCHRVVGSTGELTGFAGGIDVKRRLLAFESARPAAVSS